MSWPAREAPSGLSRTCNIFPVRYTAGNLLHPRKPA
jgi:hypothetical protein